MIIFHICICVETIAGAGPSSPTLSTRLYTGNADFLLKQDEESGSLDSNLCSRRQESY